MGSQNKTVWCYRNCIKKPQLNKLRLQDQFKCKLSLHLSLPWISTSPSQSTSWNQYLRYMALKEIHKTKMSREIRISKYKTYSNIIFTTFHSLLALRANYGINLFPFLYLGSMSILGTLSIQEHSGKKKISPPRHHWQKDFYYTK